MTKSKPLPLWVQKRGTLKAILKARKEQQRVRKLGGGKAISEMLFSNLWLEGVRKER
jgi:hypothetical protein